MMWGVLESGCDLFGAGFGGGVFRMGHPSGLPLLVWVRCLAAGGGSIGCPCLVLIDADGLFVPSCTA